MNRETWLSSLVNTLRPHLSNLGYSIPDEDKLRISCGFPSKKALSKSGRILGECWHHEAAKDGSTQILISPTLDDSLRVADIVVHELGHATGIHGHRGDFKVFMRKIGLEGPATATTAGPELKTFLAAKLDTLGPYPHAGIEALMRETGKKQSTRLIKASCTNPEQHAKPYLVRLSREALAIGAPCCPCGNEMIPELPDEEEEENAE